MSNEQLGLEALNAELWARAAFEVMQEGWDVEDQADFYGKAFADAVVAGRMSVGQLRAMTHELSQLDGEATRLAGGDLESLQGYDYFEATARRIGHHASKHGLELVKTHRKRYRYERSKQPKVERHYSLQ